ncbi:MAG TPA: RNA methyltransferase [Smithellaceae bacterium]|nr:RNA methyltransferase [Smithellaceae bacterium]
MESPFPEPSHNQLKKWTKLLQSKFRAEDRLLLAEGVKVVHELLKSDWLIEAILVLPEKISYWEKLLLMQNDKESSTGAANLPSPSFPRRRESSQNLSFMDTTRLQDGVVMSLRRNKVTEAISYQTENKKIAAPPAGARNDKKAIAPQFLHDNDASIPIYQISLAEFKKLSQDKEPEGIIAVVKLNEQPGISSLLESTSGHLLIAHEISNPQNLGALFRTARWFGFADIVLGMNCVDWTHPKVVRASMGAVFHLSIRPNVNLPVILPDVKKKYRLIGSDVRKGTAPHPVADKTALLLGSESHGLPENLIKLADESWRIPGDDSTESLSLPQAAAIMMYELSRPEAKGQGL